LRKMPTRTRSMLAAAACEDDAAALAGEAAHQGRRGRSAKFPWRPCEVVLSSRPLILCGCIETTAAVAPAEPTVGGDAALARANGPNLSTRARARAKSGRLRRCAPMRGRIGIEGSSPAFRGETLRLGRESGGTQRPAGVQLAVRLMANLPPPRLDRFARRDPKWGGHLPRRITVAMSRPCRTRAARSRQPSLRRRPSRIAPRSGPRPPTRAPARLSPELDARRSTAAGVLPPCR